MAGIVFLRTPDRAALSRFYRERVGCRMWLEQPDIDILAHGNLLIGLCQRDGPPDLELLLCFVVATEAEVDALYERLRETAEGPPGENERYRIYHFYARDPDGRRFECQCFRHPLPPIPVQL